MYVKCYVVRIHSNRLNRNEWNARLTVVMTRQTTQFKQLLMHEKCDTNFDYQPESMNNRIRNVQ